MTAIKVGEIAPSDFKSKNAKAFYHMVPGARSVMPDGLEIVFQGGVFSTADPEIIAELEKVADRPTSMIYTKRETVATVQATVKTAAADAVQ